MKPFQPQNTTVVICCAGMGTRLGIGTTKALVDICGKPLIIRLLEQLHDFDDIRIVVGFQAERLIQIVNAYHHTGIMYALTGAREYLVSLDGDTLANPDDFAAFLAAEQECLGVSPITSAEPILATVENDLVLRLSKTAGNQQWSGIVKIRTERFGDHSSHVYDVLNTIMPLQAFPIRTREIDTPEDYERAIDWFEKGCEG